jgi:hypothetical protein
MIPLEEKQEVENLLSLHRFTDADMQVLQRIVNKYISPTYQSCNYCTAQLKHILKRLRAWYDIQTFEPVNVSEGKEELKELFETPEIDVDIKEADEQGCMKCSRKKKVKK